MEHVLPLLLLAGAAATLGLLLLLTRSRFRRAQRQIGAYLRLAGEGPSPPTTPSLPAEWSELREALAAVHERLLRLRSEEQQLRALAILNETSSNILETLEIDTLLQMVSHAARVLVKAECGVVFLTDSPLKEDRIRISSAHEQSLFNAPAWKAYLWALPHQKHLYQPPSAADSAPMPSETGRPEEHRTAPFPMLPGMKNLLALPLRSPMRLQGWLAVINKQGEQPFTKEDEDLMQMLAVQALLGIEKVLLYQEKEQLAITDPLTDLFNRRELERRLSEEVRRSERYGREFSLLLLDLDHFKQLNDSRGHPAGDAVLRHLGHLLHREARILDIPFRYGGEEFAILLPETGTAPARQAAERLRARIAEEPFPQPDGSIASVTVSIGIATYPHHSKDVGTLLGLVDMALYAAKRGGRNQVCCYGDWIERAQ